MATTTTTTTTKPKAASPIPNERLVHLIQRNPFVDWMIILAAAAFIGLILVGVGFSVYLRTGDTISAPASNSKTDARLPLNVSTLQGVLSGYDDRSTERASIKSDYSAPRDPSLQ